MTPARPDPAAGVFETIRAERGAAHCLADHLARLGASVRALYGAELAGELDACVADALATAPDGSVRRLRVVATPSRETAAELRWSRVVATPSMQAAAPRRSRAAATPTAVALHASLAPLGAAAERSAVPLQPWTLAGGLGPHKWVDRRRIDEAAGRLAATPLIVEPGGEVLEAAWGNVWALEGLRLVTPPADGRLLPGVTRARLLGLAAELGLEAAEERLPLERLTRADAILLTSSLRLAVPGRLVGAPGGQGSEAAATIAAALRELVT